MIRLENISLGYGAPLLEGIEMRLERGELVGLVGRNGTGKSTLLRAVAGLRRPLGGAIFIDEKPLASLSAQQKAALIAFVTTDRVEVDHLRAGDVVALGRAPYTGWAGRLSDDDRARVDEALKLVGMHDFARKPLSTLSDGERQRVMIARALAQDTPLILLDEPTAFLDLPTRWEICLLLQQLAHRQAKAILFSTHDLSIALEVCDRLALLENRRLTCAPAAQLRFDTTTLSIEFQR